MPTSLIISSPHLCKETGSSSSSRAATGPQPRIATGAEPAAAFTPGPWQNGIDDLEGVVSVGPLAAVGDGNVICLPPEGMEASMARWPANARLIAAAPDQHAALITQRTLTARVMKALMATGFRDDLLLADEVHRADADNRAALAKALGNEAASPSEAHVEGPGKPNPDESAA